MQQLLEKLANIFTLESPSLLYSGVWWCVAVVWLLVLASALHSISKNRCTRRKKAFWAVLVIAVPIFGLLAYLPFSLSHELFPLLGVWRKPRL